MSDAPRPATAPTAALTPAPRPFLATLLMSVAVLELLARFSGSDLLQQIARGLVLTVVVLAVRQLTLREIYLLGASAVLSVLVIVTQPDPGTILSGAMDQAVFLMAFILLLGLLQATARSSPSVEILGEYLTRQPPGRRYVALSGGTSLLAVLFNLGVVSFLVPLIQQGIRRAGADDGLNPLREQRQLSALLRGFAWCVTWSPTAFAPLIVAELMPGVERTAWIGYGFAFFMLLMLVGALEDKLRFRAYRPSGKRAVMAFPRTAALRFAATTGWFLLLVVFFVEVFDGSIVFGVLAACPLMMAGWLTAQFGLRSPTLWPDLKARMRTLVVEELPGSLNVAITLACSGFIGRAGAGLTPAAEVAAFLGLGAMPDWLLLSAIPLFIALVSLLALSPTMMAVFMGSFFAALPEMPADPTLLAFSISCGWALSMTFSPFATVVLVIARASGLPATRLTWGWNLHFTLIAAILLVPLFALLTMGA